MRWSALFFCENFVFDLDNIRKRDPFALSFKNEDPANLFRNDLLETIRDPYRIMIVIQIFIRYVLVGDWTHVLDKEGTFMPENVSEHDRIASPEFPLFLFFNSFIFRYFGRDRDEP